MIPMNAKFASRRKSPKSIWKIRQINNENIPKYENILNGDVLEMIEVAKIIQANMKIQEKAKDKD
jgi:hypothetical protein